MKTPDSNLWLDIHMRVYTHKHISICYIHTCTSTKVQTDSQEPDPKLICAWHSKGRYNRAPEKKVPSEETTKAHLFQNPAQRLLHSSEIRAEDPRWGQLTSNLAGWRGLEGLQSQEGSRAQHQDRGRLGQPGLQSGDRQHGAPDQWDGVLR